MSSMHRLSAVAIVLVVFVSLARGQEVAEQSVGVRAIPDWPAPPFWNPPEQPVSMQEREGGVRTEGVVASSTSPLPFIGVNPCRLVDTRHAGLPAGYGMPALVGGLPRDFDLNDDPLCPGIPASVGAYSLNSQDEQLRDSYGVPGEQRVAENGSLRARILLHSGRSFRWITTAFAPQEWRVEA